VYAVSFSLMAGVFFGWELPVLGVGVLPPSGGVEKSLSVENIS